MDRTFRTYPVAPPPTWTRSSRGPLPDAARENPVATVRVNLLEFSCRCFTIAPHVVCVVLLRSGPGRGTTRKDQNGQDVTRGNLPPDIRRPVANSNRGH